MTEKQALALGEGDLVYWHDPDNGLRSREIEIKEVAKSDFNEVVIITDTVGHRLECPPEQLAFLTRPPNRQSNT